MNELRANFEETMIMTHLKVISPVTNLYNEDNADACLIHSLTICKYFCI